MTRNSFRNAVGVASLTGFALVMVACGGSSSSAPVTNTTVAPPQWNNSSAWTGLKANQQATLVLSASNINATSPFSVKSKTVGGTVTLNGPNLQFTAAAGDVRPTAGYTTPLTIVLTATGPGGSTDLTINPSIDPTAPQFTSTAPVGAYIPGSTYLYNLNASAPDGNKVAYKVESAKFGTTDIAAGSAAAGSGTYALTNPAAAGANAGTFQFSPSGAMANGTVNIVLSVSDVNTPTNVIAKQTFTINVGARAPIFLTTPSITSVALNHPYGYVNNGPATPYIFKVRNLDGNATSVNVSGLPAGITYTPGTAVTTAGVLEVPGTISGTASGLPGSSLVTITATDTVSGAITTQQFTLNVLQDQKPSQPGNQPNFGVQATQFHDPANLREKLIYQDANSLAVAEFRFMRSKLDGTGTWNATMTLRPDDSHSAAGYQSGFSWPLPASFATFVPDTTNWLDTYLGTQGLGWRYRAVSPDQQDRDGIFYFIKPNSVNVDGSPFTVTGNTVPTAVASVFPANTETATIRPLIYSGTFPGGIQEGGSPWSDSRVATSEYPTINSSTGEITWAPNTSAQWTFTVVAQQMVNGVPTLGQNTEIQVNVPVYENSAPWIGNLTLTGGSTVVDNVILGGGTSVSASTLGLPAAQEPIARTTAQSITITPDTTNEYYTPNPNASIWRWGIKGPGFSPANNYLGDPDSTPIGSTGHQDAWEMKVSGFTGGMLSLTSLTDSNVPAVSPGVGVFQSVQRTATATAPQVLDSLYFNPWLSNNPSKFELSWGPDREQYLVARFSGMSASNFSGYIQDEYGAYSVQNPIASFNILFGDVRITDSRYRFLTDTGVGYSPRGYFFGKSNLLNQDFLFMYLPLVNNDFASDEANIWDGLFNGGNSPNTIAGVNPLSVQYAQSGQSLAIAANTFSAAVPGSASADNWITLPHLGTVDALWTGGTVPVTGARIGYPANAINGNAAFKAKHGVTTVAGTVAGSTTYRQLSNQAAPVADGSAISIMPNSSNFTGWGASDYSNNEMMASIIPHNSPYLAQIAPRTYNSGYGLAPWVQDPALDPAENQSQAYSLLAGFWATTLHQPIHVNENGLQNIWYYGLLHSEVDYSKVIPGRGVSLPSITYNAQGTFVAASTSRIRFNFSWPSNVTAANLGVSSGANTFASADIMQLAIPNQASNGRYFFTGNAATSPGWLGQNAAYFSGTPGLSTAGTDVAAYGGGSVFSVYGVTNLVRFPIHVLTNSIFIPYQQQNGAAGFPNAVTFTAGSNYTDLPLTGIKGIIGDDIQGSNNIATLDESPVLRDSAGIPSLPPPAMAPSVHPAFIDTATAGDRLFFLWMRPDKTDATASAYATWGATALINGTPNITGGLTKATGFSMSNAPGLTDTNTELHFASGVLPGTNQGSNFNIKALMDGMHYDQFYLLATQVGHPSRTRVVKGGANGIVAASNINSLAGFLAPTNYDCIPFTSSALYAVRDHFATGDGNFGEQGIEPNAPVLATYEPFAAGAALTATTTAPAILGAFYSPFADASMNTAEPYSAYQHVLQFKMNFASAVTVPTSPVIYRQLATISQAAPISAAGVVSVIDPTTNNPNWTPDKAGNTTQAVNFTTPIVTPVRQVKLNDYQYNNTTTSTRVGHVFDLVNGDAGSSGMLNLGLGSLTDNISVNKDSNLTLTWKQGQGDQVLPSGYIAKLYKTNSAVAGGVPTLIATYYVGHTFGNPASTMQTLNLPSLNSLTGLAQGAANPNVYYFVIRSVWGQQKDAEGWTRIDMDKRPFAQGIPYAMADYVTGTILADAFAPPVVPQVPVNTGNSSY